MGHPSEAAIVNSVMNSTGQSASERSPRLRLVRPESADQHLHPDTVRQLHDELLVRRIAAANALDAYAEYLDREARVAYAHTVPVRAGLRSRQVALRLRARDFVPDRDDRAAMELVIDRIDARLNARWPEGDPVLTSWASAIGAALSRIEAMASISLVGEDLTPSDA